MSAAKHKARPRHLLGLAPSDQRGAMLRAWGRYLKAQALQRRSANAVALARRYSLTDEAAHVQEALAVDATARERLAKARSSYYGAKAEAVAHG